MLSWTFVAVACVLGLVTALVPARAARVVLAAASVAAVALLWRAPALPLLGVSLAVYALGHALPRLGERARGCALGLAVIAIVAVLGLVRRDGTSPGAPAAVLGLSYFSLKFLQHLVDAAAGRAREVDLAAFVAVVFFPPTYPAGPIERTGEFARALDRPLGWGERALGLERVVWGLAKKFLLANPLLAFAEPVFREPAGVSWGALVVATYAYAFGLYWDFAGYSDLAIGVARTLGVRVRENFDRPYLSPNLALLWQRWHMSLTSWLRDFVFFPLTRRVLRLTGRPLVSQMVGQMATMLACGLWHGVTWNFAAWGAYHGLGLGALSAWRAWHGPPATRSAFRAALGTVATFHFFALGLVLFACDLGRAALIFRRLLGLPG